MIRIGLVVVACMLAVLVAAGGRPAPRPAPAGTAPQPQNVTLQFSALAAARP